METANIMTLHEKLVTIVRSGELKAEGGFEEAMAQSKTVPFSSKRNKEC
ncbi:hypothetical protein RsTz2092_02700 [Deferribacterales bacterium RsTz2092]|nr:hypothetical protein AGMMS49941_06910 [Deferribacterales bacterium]